MKLTDLSKPQWDAAHEAARIMMRCNPDREADRFAYRTARTKLALMLPPDADAAEIIRDAAAWSITNDIAAMIVGLPVEQA